MTLNYILLAHQNPEQVSRLVNRLRGGGSVHFYIHIDLSKDIRPFRESLPPADDLTYLQGEQRFHTPWGDLGLVRAAVAGLRAIVASGREGHCILLSGQHYPIKSNAHIRAFLSQHPETNFVEYFPLPSPRWAEGGMGRLQHYKFRLSGRPRDFISLPALTDRDFYRLSYLKKFAKLLLKGRKLPDSRIFRSRRFPTYARPYGGEHWWIFSLATAKDILEYLAEHPDFLPYFEDTVLAEEICLQSIVVNLYGPASDRLAPCANYIKWTDRNNPHPETITMATATELPGRPDHQLFARKFDPKIDAEILDYIDAHLLTQSAGTLFV